MNTQEASTKMTSSPIDNEYALSGIDNPAMKEVGDGRDSSAMILVKDEVYNDEEKNGQCSLQTSRI